MSVFEKAVVVAIWLLLVLVLTWVGVSSAADVDPNGFQGHVRIVPEPAGAMLVYEQAPPTEHVAYCSWAAAWAGFGAYKHAYGVPLKTALKDRPTAARMWITYGYKSPQQSAFKVCMGEPEQLSMTEWRE